MGRGIGAELLESYARDALLGGLGIAAGAFSAGGVVHGMAFVEDDDAVELVPIGFVQGTV